MPSAISDWIVVDDEVTKEVQTALGIAGVGTQESQTALGIAGVGLHEDHSPLDRAGYEAPDDAVSESVSVPNSLSNVTIGADKKKIEEIGDNVIKQILETQLGECPCKTKSRPKA